MATVNRTEELLALLCNLGPWTPLRRLPLATTLVDADLLFVEDGFYVRVQQKNRELRTDDPNAPFITELFWAVSEGAVRRLARREIERDEGIEAPIPPTLAFGIENANYGKLLDMAKQKNFEIFESASYRAVPDSRMVSRKLAIGSVEYCFRNTRVLRAERPYSIIIGEVNGVFSISGKHIVNLYNR